MDKELVNAPVDSAGIVTKNGLESILVDGVADGARLILTHGKDDDNDFDDGNFDDDNDGNNYIKRIKKLNKKSERLCRCN